MVRRTKQGTVDVGLVTELQVRLIREAKCPWHGMALNSIILLAIRELAYREGIEVTDKQIEAYRKGWRNKVAKKQKRPWPLGVLFLQAPDDLLVMLELMKPKFGSREHIIGKAVDDAARKFGVKVDLAEEIRKRQEG